MALVFRKELLDFVRDRRAVLLMLALPLVLYPLLIIGFHYAMLIQLQVLEKKTSIVWVNGLARLPADLRDELAKPEKHLEVTEEPNPVDEADALSRGEARVILKAPVDLMEQIARLTSPVPIELHYTSGLDPSLEARQKVSLAIEAWRERVVHGRLARAGLEPKILDPVAVESVDIAPRGAILGRLLAFMIVFTSLMGAFYPAIDLGAGEKERGTLETLLLAPAKRIEIALGKFFAVAVVALAYAVVNLASLGVTFTHFMSMASGGAVFDRLGQVSFTLPVIVPMIVALIPLTALFSALTLAIATHATSYKEATSYLQPLAIVAVLLSMSSALPGVELTKSSACVPVAGVALLFKELLGGTAQPINIAFVIVSTVAYAALALTWVTSLYGQEEVLARPATALGLELFARRRPDDPRPRVPTAAQAYVAALVAVLLLWFLSDAFEGQGKGIVQKLAFVLVPLIALPPLIWAAQLRLDLKETFRLRPASGRALAAAALVALGSPVVARDINALQSLITADSLPSVEQASRQLSAQLGGLGPLVALLAIGLLPAACEEVLFRGFVLSGLATRYRPARAAIVTAVLFALAHLDPVGLGSRTLLGTVLGMLALRSASLAPAILCHFMHNGLALVFTLQEKTLVAYGLEQDGAPTWPHQAVSIAAVVAGLWLLRGVRPAASERASAPPAAV